MNELVSLEPEAMRSSLILIGLTFRTFWTVVSDCVRPVGLSVQEAWPIRSPLKAAGPDVTVKVALPLAPRATGSTSVTEVSLEPRAKDVHPLGTEMLNLMPVTDAPV